MSRVSKHFLFVVAACCGLACSAQVVFEDGGGSGGSGANGSGSNGDAGTGGGYDGFTCIEMCADLAAKSQGCNEDHCVSSCRGFISDTQAAGCLPEMLACLRRAVEVDVCAASCASDKDVQNCLANQ